MLWLLFFLVTAIRADLCQPDAENAFKVRLSIRTALGDKAYAWDTNEEYLFKAMVAFSMRKVPNRETTDPPRCCREWRRERADSTQGSDVRSRRLLLRSPEAACAALLGASQRSW
ncbi:collectrin isoform X1 [Cervus canadensis]|uniref:collectrin isoform X1 n=1 Tax=Cervus canadensis TaxID=1574408 RepID=UPI001CA341C1|nr:collectrin isoform X1 [Cervus canadensis]